MLTKLQNSFFHRIYWWSIEFHLDFFALVFLTTKRRAKHNTIQNNPSIPKKTIERKKKQKMYTFLVCNLWISLTNTWTYALLRTLFGCKQCWTHNTFNHVFTFNLSCGKSFMCERVLLLNWSKLPKIKVTLTGNARVKKEFRFSPLEMRISPQLLCCATNFTLHSHSTVFLRIREQKSVGRFNCV